MLDWILCDTPPSLDKAPASTVMLQYCLLVDRLQMEKARGAWVGAEEGGGLGESGGLGGRGTRPIRLNFSSVLILRATSIFYLLCNQLPDTRKQMTVRQPMPRCDEHLATCHGFILSCHYSPITASVPSQVRALDASTVCCQRLYFVLSPFTKPHQSHQTHPSGTERRGDRGPTAKVRVRVMPGTRGRPPAHPIQSIPPSTSHGAGSMPSRDAAVSYPAIVSSHLHRRSDAHELLAARPTKTKTNNGTVVRLHLVPPGYHKQRRSVLLAGKRGQISRRAHGNRASRQRDQHDARQRTLRPSLFATSLSETLQSGGCSVVMRPEYVGPCDPGSPARVVGYAYVHTEYILPIRGS